MSVQTGRPSQERMAENFGKYCVPGEEHNQLAYFVGQWETNYTIHMPGAPPMTGNGTAEFKLIMDGRYLVQDTVSQWGPGHGLRGYDRYRRKHFSTWVDSKRTDMWYAEADGAGDSLDFIYHEAEPMFDVAMRKMRGEQRRIDANRWTYTFIEMPEGEPERTVLTIEYRRKS